MLIPSKNTIISNTKELVINWHITEACNYKCTYCFAKWGKPSELHRSIPAIERLLDNLASYFIKGNPPIKQQLNYHSVRLNIAGGEPTMLGATLSIVLMLAKQKGFTTSIITNGSYLSQQKFQLTNNTLDMLGVSFDSQIFETRKRLGRIDRKGNSLNVYELKHLLQHLKNTQVGLITKINTVVTALNWQEDFSDIIGQLAPDKWKVLQVLPHGNDELLISTQQFDEFIKRHSNKNLPIFAESNSAMTESYLMVDPSGRFYQNSEGKSGYVYSECVNDVGVEHALAQIKFNVNTFASRYLGIENAIPFKEVV